MRKEQIESLVLFDEYDQKTLAKLWGYTSYNAIRRGIVTPSGSNIIILFVTENNTSYATKYENKLDGKFLYMSGEQRHIHDLRLKNNLSNNIDDIYLFYRKVHHSPYVFYGKVELTDVKINNSSPSEFKFLILSLEEDKNMNYYSFKTNSKEIYDKFIAKEECFEFQGVNLYNKNNSDRIGPDMPIFLLFGGNNVSWTLGLYAVLKTTSGPTDVGYDINKPNNYKLSAKIAVKLPKPMTKSDFIPYINSYDTFVGPSTKGSINQALYKIDEINAIAIIRGIIDKYPQLENQLNSVFGNEIIQKAKAPMKILVPVIKSFGDSYEADSVGTVKHIALTSEAKNIIYYGIPGSGKSYTVNQLIGDDVNYSERIVFHPEYSYTDFIGSIMPAYNKASGQALYCFKAGPFTRILKKAYRDPEHMYYLVIEELNRGNAPAIFGDTFQLLDRDQNGESKYSINNSEISDYIFDNENIKIKIPFNVSIIATINSSDQNVFTLDTAFTRRWEFRHIANDIDQCDFAKKKILDTDVTWKMFVDGINDFISTSAVNTFINDDKRIGAYFIDEKDLDLIDGEYNPAFAEKIILYLWSNVFKNNPGIIFHDKYNNMEKAIEGFKSEKFNIFKLQFGGKIDEQ